ncbi:hypothetical protein OG756_39775 [Streptomyces sp. NBC_01310]|uniref:hypothetical protein n=1 Tax=Streptomyces sp. NBC_01310 TaxID=2903820 RepID=UPI0035B630CF|nr:hypothetical protein OG756_39775 [Streptomyces sp. NBC_01310]
MSDMDFYAHVATRCEVLGSRIGSGPGHWAESLGPAYVDVPGGGLLRRDHGLVEVTFSSESPGQGTCTAFGVQVHRLLHDQGPGQVPAPLSRRYGAFAPRARFEELRAAVEALGHTIELDDPSGDIHRYRVPDSGTRVFVVADPDPYGYGDHDPDDPEEVQIGDIWSIAVAPAPRDRPDCRTGIVRCPDQPLRWPPPSRE